MKKVKLNLQINKDDLREKLQIKDPIEETGSQIVEKLSPLKNVLNFEVLTNIPDFALSRDVVGYRGGEGGGGTQLIFQDESVNITSNPILKFNVTGSGGNLIYSGNGIATLELTAQESLEKRHDWVAPNDYCGTAPLGSSESASVWTITRIVVANDGSTTTTTQTNVKWSDRLTIF